MFFKKKLKPVEISRIPLEISEVFSGKLVRVGLKSQYDMHYKHAYIFASNDKGIFLVKGERDSHPAFIPFSAIRYIEMEK